MSTAFRSTEEPREGRVGVLQRWLREPLLHFLMAGGVLFAVYAWIHDGIPDDPKKDRVVRITAEDVEWLTQTWGRTRQSQPSRDELKDLVTSYLRESLLAREARELGLDENDTIVRRRLAQKMEFLVEDTARLAEPGEAELHRYYVDNHSRYDSPARISFAQIFFKTEADARKGMEAIASGRTAGVGEPTLLQPDYRLSTPHTVEGLFGPGFADRLFALQPGQWLGPVASGYGYHLVRVDAHVDAGPRPFRAVRARVLDDWNRQQQDQTSEQFYAALLKKYDVVVDESVKPLIGALAQVAQ